jgi:hypothetical protein
MNPTVPEAFIRDAYAEDEAKASAEYGAQFRRDLEAFVSREAVGACVVPGRFELPPVPGVKYVGFVDPSGGSQDAMTLAIAHAEDGRPVLDLLREVKPPFSPEAVVQEFAETLTAYRINTIIGDRYGGEWPREQFRKAGIAYEIAERSKSDLYRDTLPLINSGRVELLDHPRLVAQLCGLERRTARGGKDSIDHPPGGHDDLANAGLGAVLLALAKRVTAHLWLPDLPQPGEKPPSPDQRQVGSRLGFLIQTPSPDDLTCRDCAGFEADQGRCRPRKMTTQANLPACPEFESKPVEGS